jgi:hypothetical protein
VLCSTLLMLNSPNPCLTQKAALACGSMVLYVFVYSFQPAG